MERVNDPTDEIFLKKKNKKKCGGGKLLSIKHGHFKGTKIQEEFKSDSAV